MRTLRIRAFTLLCLVLITLLPWVFFVGAQYLETRSFSLADRGAQSEVLQHQIQEAIRLIETEKDRWGDPDWQNRLYTELRKAKMDVAIESAAGQEIYISNPDRRSTRLSTERFSVIEDGRLVGRATLLLPRSYTVQAISAVAGLLLAFFIIGVEMRRFLLKPLEKMSAAARQIASGDWDVRLPRSRITEIAEVRDGFDTMVKGLERAHRKQAELEEGRRFVIAAVAHDLRTPLFALRGYLDGLEQGIAKSPEKVAQYLAVCKEKSAQLDLLVEDLFTYTKLEYLETEFHEKTLDLGLILRKSADNLKARAAEKQIALSVHPDGDALVSGDAHLLERAMNNILENAVRHTPIGGEITVQCHRDDGKVRFGVRDTGPGFSAEELKHVFEPLYRGEASRNRSTGGSGLGLTISQRIIRQHGGELAASNHAEGGAVLAGWIPVKTSAPSDE